eukprot:TRINITY_DN1380_c0_g1_i1.p2 TRINITY_DN1380_c0_g1~~TRINITY_DN1380_c0_g1_i1.p2  ORF type:complete len:161 (+),score=32.82 TRINITY_DN1380_c0_g1_i1:54-536(+)
MDELFQQAKDFLVQKLAEVEKPSVHVDDTDVHGFDRGGVLLKHTIKVSNPYSHDIPLFEIMFEILSQGTNVVSGTIPNPPALTANGETDFDIPTRIPFSSLKTLHADIKEDWDIDYTLRGALKLDLPFIGQVMIPFEKDGTFKLPTMSDILSILASRGEE